MQIKNAKKRIKSSLPYLSGSEAKLIMSVLAGAKTREEVVKISGLSYQSVIAAIDDLAKLGQWPEISKLFGKNGQENEANNLSQPFEKGFDKFWALYPRKLNRIGALQCWIVRRRDGIDEAELMQAGRNYAEAMKSKEARYILHGSTFLGPRLRFKDWLDDGAAWLEFKKRPAIGRGIKGAIDGDKAKRLAGIAKGPRSE